MASQSSFRTTLTMFGLWKSSAVRIGAARVVIDTKGDRYLLVGELNSARGRVPLPDPGLTLEEASQLAKGTTAAHKKLKSLIDLLLGGGPRHNGHNGHHL